MARRNPWCTAFASLGLEAMRWPVRFLFLVLCSLMASRCSLAEDDVAQAIRLVMEENLAASDAEDMERLLRTMSQEMPNRELFIRETEKEWALADTYTRLEEIEVLKQSRAPRSNTRLPYATVRVVQTMLKSEREPGVQAPSEWSRRMLLDQEHATVAFLTLWKREAGKWRIVAGLTEPRPVRKPEKKELE